MLGLSLLMNNSKHVDVLSPFFFVTKEWEQATASKLIAYDDFFSLHKMLKLIQITDRDDSNKSNILSKVLLWEPLLYSLPRTQYSPVFFSQWTQSFESVNPKSQFTYSQTERSRAYS